MFTDPPFEWWMDFPVNKYKWRIADCKKEIVGLLLKLERSILFDFPTDLASSDWVK